MGVVTELGIALVTLATFEPVMATIHRFLFHGPLWCWHKSHHEQPTARQLVLNDLLWMPPLLTAAALIAVGVRLSPGIGPDAMVGLGIGTAAYVAAYVLAHDGVAHGRFPVPPALRRMAVFRVVARTHSLHHRGGRTGTGAVPFGVYAAHLEYRWRLNAGYAPPTKLCSPIKADGAHA
jgi:beta-carotene 3-hydroxylase